MATALLLPPPPPDYAGPEVKAPVCPLVRKEFEAGGRAFEQLLCTFLGIEGEADTDESLAGQRTSSKAKMQQQKKKGLQSVKLTDDELAVDHYEVLELGKLQWNATEDQIKTAYRRLVVETHPDKTQGGDDTAFKAVQKAYEILSDPQKRLAFDSSIDFDDDIPSLKVAPENFYEVFGDAFHRNSRWSTSRNVPMLGDDSTPIEEVEKFYDFWFTFKSWRDFSHVDTHTIEEADCREEKRWMEKENARERAKLQRQENKRIFTLTERAKMLDPRIKRHKEEQARKKEEEKKAAEAEKQRQREERARLEREKKEAEEKRLKEEAAQKKAEQKKRKEEAKRTRERCVKALKPFVLEEVNRELSDEGVCKPDMEYLFGKLDLEKLQALEEALIEIATKCDCAMPDLTAACRGPVVAHINELITSTEQAAGFDRFGNRYVAKKDTDKPEEAKATKSSAKVEDKWTEQELVDLGKAIAKFPGGSFNRWDNIAAYIGTKTPDQVLRRTKLMTHQLHAGEVAKPEIFKQGDAKPLQEEKKEPAVDMVWSKAQQKELEDALKQLKDYKEKDKWDKIAALVTGKSKKECVERYKYLATMLKKK